jgi:hypothetical protein
MKLLCVKQSTRGAASGFFTVYRVYGATVHDEADEGRLVRVTRDDGSFFAFRYREDGRYSSLFHGVEFVKVS